MRRFQAKQLVRLLAAIASAAAVALAQPFADDAAFSCPAGYVHGTPQFSLVVDDACVIA